MQECVLGASTRLYTDTFPVKMHSRFHDAADPSQHFGHKQHDTDTPSAWMTVGREGYSWRSSPGLLSGFRRSLAHAYPNFRAPAEDSLLEAVSFVQAAVGRLIHAILAAFRGPPKAELRKRARCQAELTTQDQVGLQVTRRHCRDSYPFRQVLIKKGFMYSVLKKPVLQTIPVIGFGTKAGK